MMLVMPREVTLESCAGIFLWADASVEINVAFYIQTQVSRSVPLLSSSLEVLVFARISRAILTKVS